MILARFAEASVLTGFCSIPVAFLLSEEWAEAGRMYFKEIGSAAIMIAVVQAVVIITPMILEGVIVTSAATSGRSSGEGSSTRRRCWWSCSVRR